MPTSSPSGTECTYRYGRRNSTNRLTHRVESTDGVNRYPPLRIVGFFGMSERDARSEGREGMGAEVDGATEGGSVFEGVRMRFMGSGRRVHNCKYFSSNCLSWSGIVFSEASSSGGVEVPFVTGAEALEGVRNGILFRRG
jgi:hypothetical protein